MPDFTSPFLPQGPAAALFGSGTTASAMLINQVGPFSLLMFNRSATFDGYLAYGPTSASISSAVAPVIAGPPIPSQNVFPIPARSLQAITLTGPCYIGLLVPGGNAAVDLVQGEGE